MFISNYSIKKPIITTVVMVALVVFGLISLLRLDTDEFPDWLQTYQRVAITLDDEGAKEPGKVILSGDLPTAG